MKRLSLVQISNATSAQRELNAHQSTTLHCVCNAWKGDDHMTDHSRVYESNRF